MNSYPRPQSFRVAVTLAVLAGGLGAAIACGKSSSDGGGGSDSDSGTSGSGGGSSSGATSSGGSSGGGETGPTPDACNGSVKSTVSAAANPPAPPALTLAKGFKLETVAAVGEARELAALPNGDLLVATRGNSVYLVPNADSATPPGKPTVFATINDTWVQGIAFAAQTCTVYVATHAGVYKASYKDAQQTASFGSPIATVRTGQVAPNSDGDVHVSSSVGVAGGSIYVGVGSSCNACTEVDPTRAVVLQMNPDGTGVTTKATRFRNAIALATNPATGTLWAGGAGQDNLASDHPYEFFDAVTLHAGTADYGWPDCEENHTAYVSGSDCSKTVAPRVELPAYSTIIGAAFYPAVPAGPYAFSQAYAGGLFLAAHGSWHQDNGKYVSPPRVAFVAMSGDTPVTPVNWADPTAQWKELLGGFQEADGVTRIGRPTGVAIGAQGSLFVADDQTGQVYRIRPQ
jgi:glucose/arabinose dehydrogenase